jgi:hypothetical protein
MNKPMLLLRHRNIELIVKADQIISRRLANLLDGIVTFMDRIMIPRPDSGKLTIKIYPDADQPYCNVKERVIILAPKSILKWSQISYQFAHEYLHWIIGSPWPGQKYLWLEESFCEASSLLVSENLSNIKFTDATLNSSINRADFDKYYLDAISAKQILWPLFDVLDSKDADGILPSLLRSEETALSRPHLQFLAVQLLALLKGDLSRWPDVHQLSRFSNGATLRENLSESAVNSNSDLWTQVLLIFDNCTQSR